MMALEEELTDSSGSLTALTVPTSPDGTADSIGRQMDAGKEDTEGSGRIAVDEAALNEAPDGGWGWFIVVGGCLIHFLMGGMERSHGILFLQLLDRFDQSATATAWVTSICYTLTLSLGPISSALCNRFTCRTVCVTGALVCTVGVILSAFAPNVPFLYFSFSVLGGIGSSLVYTPSLIIVGYYFNKRRGVAVGLATSCVGIGAFAFPAMVETMFETFGYTGAFLMLAAIGSNYLVAGVLFRPLTLHRRIMENDRLRVMRDKHNADGDCGKNLLETVPSRVLSNGGQHYFLDDLSATKMASSTDIVTRMKTDSRKASLFSRNMSKIMMTFKGSSSRGKDEKTLLDLSLFKNFAFTMLCSQLFLFTLAFNTTFVFMPAFAKENHMTQMQGAILVSIMGIVDALARIIMSTILDLKKVKPYRLIIYNIVMFLTGIVAVLIPSARTFWQFAIISAIFGILTGTYISQKSVVIVDVLGVESLSSSFGFMLLFQGLGAFVGPTIGGLFKDYLGSFAMVFYFGSIGVFTGGFVMAAGNVWLYKQKKKQGKDEV